MLLLLLLTAVWGNIVCKISKTRREHWVIVNAYKANKRVSRYHLIYLYDKNKI